MPTAPRHRLDPKPDDPDRRPLHPWHDGHPRPVTRSWPHGWTHAGTTRHRLQHLRNLSFLCGTRHGLATIDDLHARLDTCTRDRDHAFAVARHVRTITAGLLDDVGTVDTDVIPAQDRRTA